MYEKHMLARDDIQSVVENGVGTKVYRQIEDSLLPGVCLSLVEDIQGFNDRLFTRDQLTFSVSGETFTFKEMETQTTFRWEFGEKATVFVPLPGGTLGMHRIEVTVSIRISYMGGTRPFTVVLENVSPMGG